jgi:hypothetical protein
MAPEPTLRFTWGMGCCSRFNGQFSTEGLLDVCPRGNAIDEQ